MSVPITRDDLICQMASKMLLLLAIIDQIVSSVGTLLIGILVARQGGNLIYADFVISMVAVALSNSVLDSVVYSPFVLGYDDRRLDSAVSVAVFHQLPFSIAL